LVFRISDSWRWTALREAIAQFDLVRVSTLTAPDLLIFPAAAFSYPHSMRDMRLSLRLPAFEVGYLLLMTKERFSFLHLEPELDFVPEASVPILYIFHAPPKSYSDQRPSSLRVDEVEQLLILFWGPPPFAFLPVFTDVIICCCS
jgi:hypothetical protein